MIADKKLFERAKVLAAAEQLRGERRWKKSYDEMEAYQQIICRIEGNRAASIMKMAIKIYKEMINV